MKIIPDWPPNIDSIRAVFPLPEGVIFTYGDTIYNPYSGKITDALIAHESVHHIQQTEYMDSNIEGDDGIEGWWKRYLINPEWRYSQELEAHQAEYKAYCSRYLDSKKRVRFLLDIAGRLASPMYGSMVDLQGAIKAIRGV